VNYKQIVEFAYGSGCWLSRNTATILIQMNREEILKKGKSNKRQFFLWMYVCCLPLLLSSCVFFPKTKQEELEVSDCRLRMPEWELKNKMIESVAPCTGKDEQALGCLAGIGIVIPAGSFVVSGSIVVTGNTIRWLEYQGGCEEGIINKSLVSLKGSGYEQITDDSEN
jgi:hypothetical protein